MLKYHVLSLIAARLLQCHEAVAMPLTQANHRKSMLPNHAKSIYCLIHLSHCPLLTKLGFPNTKSPETSKILSSLQPFQPFQPFVHRVALAEGLDRPTRRGALRLGSIGSCTLHQLLGGLVSFLVKKRPRTEQKTQRDTKRPKDGEDRTRAQGRNFG